VVAPDGTAGACFDATTSCLDGNDPARFVPDGTPCGAEGSICVAQACVVATCGDGIVTIAVGEECDGGANNGDVADACRTTCLLPSCGDGIVDGSEECDAGGDNGDAPNACRATCVLPACGDGILDANEACDTGEQNSDVRGGACRTACLLASCGDNVRDPGEECDEGPLNSDELPDGCRATCVVASCGDGVVDRGEECDDGAANGDLANACRSSCVAASCGDGVLDEDEACDNGGQNSDVRAGACRTSCALSSCGDSVRDPGEGCDEGPLNSDVDAGACRTNCALPGCGDGIVDGAEECDAGAANGTSANQCRPTCRLPSCGDGVLDVREQCDNGAQNSDVLPGACRTTCVPAACGDNIRDPGEGCDDGALNSDTVSGACRTSCSPARCGDGIVDGGEECDTGAANGNAANACRVTCRRASCGDGVIDATEACDNGTQNSDIRAGACRTTCAAATCGDGVRDPGEGCDDGALNSDMVSGACRTGCAPARCGDGIVDGGEECDAGAANGNAANACRATCVRASCGDGILDANEACDNGTQNSDVQSGACRTRCVRASCGDGVRDAGEACDEGVANSDVAAGACRLDCARASCGDRVVDPGESCDDGNATSGDGCRGDCLKVERCGDAVVDANEACDDGNDNLRDGCAGCRTQTWRSELLVTGATEGRLAVGTNVNFPQGLAIDLLGRIYVADSNNQRILRINTDDTVVTIAGTGATRPTTVVPPAAGDGGPATSAGLLFPTAVAVDARGRVVIHDERLIRRVEQDGTIRTISTNGSGQQGAPLAVDARGVLFARTALAGFAQIADDGAAVPVVPRTDVRAIAFDTAGRIYLADGPRVVRVADSCGTSATCTAGTCEVPAGATVGRCVQVIAGNGEFGFSGDNGPATTARLSNVGGVAVDAVGGVIIADTLNDRIRRVDAQGIITTVAGTGASLFSGDGGPAREASLGSPGSLVIDPQGRIVFIDTFNNRVRRIELDGTIDTILGSGPPGFVSDGGAATSAVINASRVTEFETVAIDDHGRVVFADTGNRLIRRIDDDGAMTLVAGRIGTEFTGGGFGVDGFSGEGGPAVAAGFAFPSGIAVDQQGRIVIADAFNHCVRRIETDGTVRTIAGGGGLLSRPDVGLTTPQWRCDLTLFNDGVCDCGCGAPDPDCFGLGVATPGVGVGHPNCDRCADTDGTPLPGDVGSRCIPPSGFSGDGGPATNALFATPNAVAIDELGRVVIADTENHRVRRIDETGVVTTIAGTGVAGFSGDGDLATQATLNEPYGVFVDAAGIILIADTQNERIRRIGADGVIATIVGNGSPPPSGDGGPAIAAGIGEVYSVTADAQGRVYLTDATTIRRVDVNGLINTIAGNDPDPTGCTVPGDAISCPTGDGGPATRALLVPSAVAVDRQGRIVFTDSVRRGANAPGSIRRIEADGTLVTIAGLVDPAGSGPFARARLYPSAALASLSPGAIVSVGALGRALNVDLAQRVVDVAVGYRAFVNPRAPDPGSPASPSAAGRARFAPLLGDARGVVVDPLRLELLITARGTHELRVVGLDPDDDGVIDQPARWTNETRLLDDAVEGPAGIAYHAATDTFLLVDESAHCVRRIDRTGVVLGTAGGRCGLAGVFLGFLDGPTHVAVSPVTGAVYVADTGNQRVLRLLAGEAALVVGDGSESSAGEGVPARLFPVQAPRQLALDSSGNLYVASTSTVRLIANVDGDAEADGDDRVFTIFGGGERQDFPASDAFCMRTLTLGADDAVYAADSCQGFLVRITPTTTP
jgi:cysteine-rich repeat protein